MNRTTTSVLVHARPSAASWDVEVHTHGTSSLVLLCAAAWWLFARPRGPAKGRAGKSAPRAGRAGLARAPDSLPVVPESPPEGDGDS